MAGGYLMRSHSSNCGNSSGSGQRRSIAAIVLVHRGSRSHQGILGRFRIEGILGRWRIKGILGTCRIDMEVAFSDDWMVLLRPQKVRNLQSGLQLIRYDNALPNVTTLLSTR